MSRPVPVCHLTRYGHEGFPCIGGACSAARWYPGDHMMFCGLVVPYPILPPEGAGWEDPAGEPEAEPLGATVVCPLCHGVGAGVGIDALNADGSVTNPVPAVCMACDGAGTVERARVTP